MSFKQAYKLIFDNFGCRSKASAIFCRLNRRSYASVVLNSTEDPVRDGPSTRLYTWGYSGTGAMGLRQFFYTKPGKRKKPREVINAPYRADLHVESLQNAKHFGLGYGFTVFSGKRGLVYGCGLNTDSQLGFHDHTSKHKMYLAEPKLLHLPVDSASLNVLEIACGRAHTAVLTNEGIFTLGNNAYGQCGRPVIEKEVYAKNRVVHKVALDSVKNIVCGQDHTLFLTADGQVYSCGLSSDGQTGSGKVCSTISEPTLVSGAIKGVRISQLVCKHDTVLAISDEGELFGWGNNEYNQLAGVDDTQILTPMHLPVTSHTGKVKHACAGGACCGVVNEHGQVYTWGYGMLGHGQKDLWETRPTVIPETLFGKREYHDGIVESLYCGMGFWMAVTKSRHIYAWGKNKSGCLGLGHSFDQYFPLKVLEGAKKVYCGADHVFVKYEF